MSEIDDLRKQLKTLQDKVSKQEKTSTDTKVSPGIDFKQNYVTSFSVDPTEIKKIDLFLEKYVQNISFIQYKKLTNTYQQLSHENRDYYSNTVYKITYISIKDCYDFLLENKLI